MAEVDRGASSRAQTLVRAKKGGVLTAPFLICTLKNYREFSTFPPFYKLVTKCHGVSLSQRAHGQGTRRKYTVNVY
jgi:hypothetical protein